MSPVESGHRPDIQGLRAVAVGLVILSHLGLSLVPGGTVGVDVFFVISGFLITRLLFRQLAEKDGIDLSGFYLRRLSRLLPALLAMLGLTAVAAGVLLSVAEQRAMLSSAPYAATWTSNLLFAFTATDYFDELAARDLFLHTWSLGVEEQFYLFWPLLMLLALRRSNGAGALRASLERLTGLLIAGLILSLGLCLFWSGNQVEQAFYQMPARIWQFAAGGLAFALSARMSARRQAGSASAWRGPALVWAGLLLITWVALWLPDDRPYPSVWAIPPTLGAFLILIGGDSCRHPLRLPALGWIGDRSYSLYLWHWPILGLGFSFGWKGQLLPTLALLLGVVLAGMLSYRLIELPFWKGRWRASGSRRHLWIGLGVMASVAALLHLRLTSLPADDWRDLASQAWRVDAPEIYTLRCDHWYHDAVVEACELGNPQAERVVVLIGDSIGAQWYSLIPAIYGHADTRIVVHTKSSCPQVDQEFYYARIGRNYTVCTNWRDAMLDEVAALQPQLVLIGSAANYAFEPSQWIEGSARVLARLSASAGQVLVIPGTPRLDFDGPSCVRRHLQADGQIDLNACTEDGDLRQVRKITGYLEQAASRFDNVAVLDLSDIVCPSDRCGAVTADGQIVFRDSQHLADSFVRSRAGIIRQRIEALTRP